MKRKLLKSARAASGAACVATAIVWVSTYFAAVRYSRYIAYETDDALRPVFLGVSTERGEIEFDIARINIPSKSIVPSEQKLIDGYRDHISRFRTFLQSYGPGNYRPEFATIVSEMGFEFWARPHSLGIIRSYGVGIRLPLWFLFVLFAALPAGPRAARIAHALLHAPPPAKQEAPTWKDGLHKVGALVCVALFVLIHVTIQATQTVGWSCRFTWGKTFIELAAQDRRLSVTVVNDWPESQPFTFLPRPDAYHLLYPYRDAALPLRSSSILGFTWMRGPAPFFRDEDGAISRLPYGKNPYFMKRSAPFAYQQFQASLFGLGLLAAALPIWWAVGRARRRLRRYISVRDSLCGKCGYNLSGNVSGVCPECGTAQLHGGRLAATK
jgi:hypothetical protein